jgi:hypothetical protein
VGLEDNELKLFVFIASNKNMGKFNMNLEAISWQLKPNFKRRPLEQCALHCIDPNEVKNTKN